MFMDTDVDKSHRFFVCLFVSDYHENRLFMHLYARLTVEINYRLDSIQFF